MKYLDGYPELDLLSKALSFSSPSLRVSTRIEAYSCKAIARERKLFKVIEHDLLSDLSLSTSISPPDSSNAQNHAGVFQSAFGPLDLKSSRKTLWLLINTLNIAFPDHDFSTLTPEDFLKEENARIVLASLTSALAHLRSNGNEGPPGMPLALGQLQYGGSTNGGNGSATNGKEHSVLDIYRAYSSSAPPAQSNLALAAAAEKNHTAASTSKNGGNSSSSSSSTKVTTKKGNGKEAIPAIAHKPTASTKTISSTHQQRVPTSTSTAKSKMKMPVNSKQQKTTTKASSSNPAGMTHTTLMTKLRRNELDGTYEVPTHPLLRQVLDPIIDLSECEVYSYTPDLDSDPHAYQSDDEEDEDDEDENEYDDVRESDGLDLDLDMDMGDVDMDTDGFGYGGGDTTPGNSMPSTPSAFTNLDNGTFPTTTSPFGSQQQQSLSSKNNTPGRKKRNASNVNGVGSAKRPARSRQSSTRGGPRGRATEEGEGGGSGQPIFPTDMSNARNAFTYGSMDEYSYSRHDNARQSRHHSSSSLRDDMHSASDDDDENDAIEDDNGGLLWSSNYFFYNKKMKRILFVSCWGRKIGKTFSPSSALLGRSGVGNPLHYWRKERDAALRRANANAGAHHSHSSGGRVTINLNRRVRAASNAAAASDDAGQDENGTSSKHNSQDPQGNNKPSNLSNALRSSGVQGDSAPPASTSFASPPPIANAAAVFRPSSPFPLGDNRHLPQQYQHLTSAPGTPSGLSQHHSASFFGGGDDSPRPPIVRDSSTLPDSRPGTPSSAAFSTGGNNPPGTPSGSQQNTPKRGGKGRPRSRGNSRSNTPARKSARRGRSRSTNGGTVGTPGSTPKATTS